LERLATLLNHLMQISRLEAGAVEFDPLEIDLGEFVQGAISRLIPAAEAKGISIHSEIEPGISNFSVIRTTCSRSCSIWSEML
jgi:signal transduction histidine kinase